MINRRSLLPAGALLLGNPAAFAADLGRSAERERLVATIEARARDRRYGVGRPLSAAVRRAMRETPRHLFVPEQVRSQAYDDQALPIGYGATISQPLIVALMTDLLQPDRADVVLEVGTGSGYQAAILSRLVRQVYSIEIIAALAERAAKQLGALGYDNVEVRAGDGYAGWPEHAPFDGIVVTAGATHVPQPLVIQLKPGGRMVIPVAAGSGGQELTVVEKDRNGRVRVKRGLPVSFVPLDERARRRN
jgi:protein-L-isoaspartate(D-aspartate) O-methyltransferase